MNLFKTNLILKNGMKLPNHWSRFGRGLLLFLALGSVSASPNLQAASRITVWGEGNGGQPADLANVVAIAGGWNHSLALRSNGKVAAWSAYNFSQSRVPSDLTNAVAVAAGSDYGMALRSNRTVAFWSYDSPSMGQVPADLTNVAAIAGGGGSWHALVLKTDGTVVAWGFNDYGQTNVPAGLANVVAIAAGSHNSLALKADGTVVGWGSHDADGLKVPAGLSNVVAIAAGSAHCLALKADGTVMAWGYNNYGQTNVPPGLIDAVAVAAGEYHSLALKADGTVLVWGENRVGQTNVPPEVTNVVAIAAGAYHSLALQGDGRPFLITPLVSRSVVRGEDVSFRMTATGARPLSYQWQFKGIDLAGATNAILTLTNMQSDREGTYAVRVSNAFGVTTSTGARLSLDPLLIAANPQDQTAFVGATVSCDVLPRGLGPFSYQWQFDGANLEGATNRTLTLVNVRKDQAGLYGVIVRNAYGMARSSDARLSVGLVAVWGDNRYGLTDVPPGLTNVAAIAAGGGHILVLKGDGNVVAWGRNDHGQTNVPVGLTNVVAIAAGNNHSLALRADGTVVAWGDNSFDEATVPLGLTNVVGLAAGTANSLALKADGTVVAWGYAGYGAYAYPVPAGLSNVVAMAAGYSHNHALKADGTVVAWGYESSFQTSIFPWLTNVVAIAASTGRDLALKGDGTLADWHHPTTPSADLVAIALSDYYGLALKADGAVVAWDTYTGDVWADNPAGLTNVIAIAQGATFFVVLVGDGSPVVTVHPFTQTAFSGERVMLSSRVAGAPPLSYRWQFNGTNLAGGTDSVLTFPDVTTADAGLYRVAVSNAYSAASSRTAQLTVIDSAPFILMHPSNVVSLPSGKAEFRIRADGTKPLTYQWRLDGVELAGATNDVLALDGVTTNQAGSYSVVVSNRFGTLASYAALLLVTDMAGVLDTPGWIWTTSEPMDEEDEDRPWRMQGLVTHDGVAAAQSGGIPSDAGTWLRTTLTGPGTLTFWWKISSQEYYSRLTFSTAATGGTAADEDWQSVEFISGEVDWQPQTQFVPAGEQILTWDFWRDEESQGGQNAGWLDQVSFTPGSIPRVVSWGGEAEGGLPGDLTEVVAVAPSYRHTLALKRNGTVVGWGSNAEWPDCDDDTCSPVFNGKASPPADLTNVVAIAAGMEHSLALRADGTVVAWGQGTNLYGYRRAYGQALVPPGLSNVVAIAAGWYHSLALKSDGTVAAWGKGDSTNYHSDEGVFGQALVPPGLSNVVALAAGYAHSLALKNDGTVAAWGGTPQSGYGFVGAKVPAGLSNVVAVAAGAIHSLALTRDGALIAWDVLGVVQTNTPTDLTGVVSIAAAADHNLALKGDGTVVVWKRNHYNRDYVPPGLTNVLRIAAGGYRNMAIVGERPLPPHLTPLTSPIQRGNTFSVSLPTIRGMSYRPEFKDSLAQPTWTMLPPLSGDGHVKTLTDPAATVSQRFYRVVCP